MTDRQDMSSEHVDDPLDYLYEELSAGDAAEVRRHLAACPSCREDMKAVRTTVKAYRSAGRPKPPAGLAKRAAAVALAEAAAARRATATDPAPSGAGPAAETSARAEESGRIAAEREFALMREEILGELRTGWRGWLFHPAWTIAASALFICAVVVHVSSPGRNHSPWGDRPAAYQEAPAAAPLSRQSVALDDDLRFPPAPEPRYPAPAPLPRAVSPALSEAEIWEEPAPAVSEPERKLLRPQPVQPSARPAQSAAAPVPPALSAEKVAAPPAAVLRPSPPASGSDATEQLNDGTPPGDAPPSPARTARQRGRQSGPAAVPDTGMGEAAGDPGPPPPLSPPAPAFKREAAPPFSPFDGSAPASPAEAPLSSFDMAMPVDEEADDTSVPQGYAPEEAAAMPSSPAVVVDMSGFGEPPRLVERPTPIDTVKLARDLAVLAAMQIAHDETPEAWISIGLLRKYDAEKAEELAALLLAREAMATDESAAPALGDASAGAVENGGRDAPLTGRETDKYFSAPSAGVAAESPVSAASPAGSAQEAAAEPAPPEPPMDESPSQEAAEPVSPQSAAPENDPPAWPVVAAPILQDDTATATGPDGYFIGPVSRDGEPVGDSAPSDSAGGLVVTAPDVPKSSPAALPPTLLESGGEEPGRRRFGGRRAFSTDPYVRDREP